MLENSDPAFVAQQELDSLANEINSAMQVLGDGAIEQQNYNQAMNQLTPALARFPYPRIKRIFRSEANEFIDSLEAEARNLSWQIQELEALASNANLVAKQSQKEADEISEQVRRSKGEIEGIFSQFESTNSAKTAEMIAELRSEFSEERNRRSERFQDEINSRREEIAKLKSDTGELRSVLQSELETIRKQQRDDVSGLLHEAKQKYNDIDQLFQEAGQTILAGGFAQASKLENDSYENDAWYAKLSFGLAAIALAILAGYDLYQGSFTWQDAVFKLPISIVLAAPGFYFAGLAAKHRKEANRLRSLGLRISAFDAFVQAAGTDEAPILRSKIAPFFFSEGLDEASDDTGDLVSDKFLEAFGKVADKMPKLGK